MALTASWRTFEPIVGSPRLNWFDAPRASGARGGGVERASPTVCENTSPKSSTPSVTANGIAHVLRMWQCKDRARIENAILRDCRARKLGKGLRGGFRVRD